MYHKSVRSEILGTFKKKTILGHTSIIKFLGHFKTPFWVTSIIRSTQTGTYLSNEANIFNKSEFDYSLCKLMGGSVHDCFCRHQHSGSVQVTRKLDLDRTSREHICADMKDANATKVTFCCKFGVYSLGMTLFG